MNGKRINHGLAYCYLPLFVMSFLQMVSSLSEPGLYGALVLTFTVILVVLSGILFTELYHPELTEEEHWKRNDDRY